MSAWETGLFAWTLHPPFLSALPERPRGNISVKDPSIVRYGNAWHLFISAVSDEAPYHTDYLTFSDFADAAEAERHPLKLHDTKAGAPQVFYFRPQETWYLVYQTVFPEREPKLQASYSTTKDITDPTSWSRARPFFDEGPEIINGWLDFWIICDAERAHLFYTSCNGTMSRTSTSLSDFPRGFSPCQIVLESHGEGWRLFEASHTYRLKGQDRYVTIVEGTAPYRYFQAYTAEHLDGTWEPLAISPDKSFADMENIEQPVGHWTDHISHGECIRDGYDETLTLDPDRVRMVIQGVDAKGYASESYGKIPWQLGVLQMKTD